MKPARPLKVRIFEGSVDKVQDEVNVFLSATEPRGGNLVPIRKVKFVTQTESWGEGNWNLTITIWYKLIDAQAKEEG